MTTQQKDVVDNGKNPHQRQNIKNYDDDVDIIQFFTWR